MAIRTRAAPARPAEALARPRLLSVDTYRGLAILLMIIVNNPGSWDHLYGPLQHSAWHGFTPTDFVFPSFLFLVGVATALSLSRAREAPSRGVYTGLLRRGAVLFLIGLCITALATDFDWAHLRIPGVLQRIAVVFVIGAFLFLKIGDKALAGTAFGLLFLYHALMNWVPVPGQGAPNLEPETNLGAWLDRAVLGTDHLWAISKTWDPEGILSTLPAIATGLFGILAGVALRSGGDPYRRVRLLALSGAALAAAGLAWSAAFPINKNLWTSSYVLLTSGLSLLVLALLHWSIDIRGAQRWSRPVVVFGTNSILAYVLSELFGTLLRKIPTGQGSLFETLYDGLCAPLFSDPRNASLAWSLTYVALFALPLWILHRQRIFVRI